MKLLADYHHHDLWESLELLCERLGWELYRPIGMDWFEQDYWVHEKKWHGDAIARQYLTPWGSDEVGMRWDPSHKRWQNIVTLEEARDLKPDIVMSTLAHNHEGFARFASEVGAIFGLQLGNVRFSHIDAAEDRWDLAKFGLLSSIYPIDIPVPTVTYHQEFSLEDFRPTPIEVHDPLRIASFVQCFPENQRTYPLFVDTATSCPQYDWGVYGAYGSVPLDQFAKGNIDTCAGIGEAMRQVDIAYHGKQWSDGFGHVIHNWFAVGRPVIGYASYYTGGTGSQGEVYLPQLAGALFQEGVTSFDITGKTAHEVGNLLAELQREPERIVEMGANAARRFSEVVNYDAEEQAIRAMFAQVLP